MKHCLLLLCCVSLTFSQTPIYKNPTTQVEQRVQNLLSLMTLEEKIDMIGGVEGFSIRPNERLGIPKIKMADGPLGVRNYGPATAFPAGIARAATWNPELEKKLGAAVGTEARSKGVHIMLAPGVNIYRAPMCGRNFEYFGEDPYLAARMTAAYVKGVQSLGVAATVKHFAANNQEWNRHEVSSDVSERALQEIYLPAFKAAVTEGAVGAVMTSYNLINGVHASQNDHLIRDILKGQWKFDGLVMSDWGSTYDGIAAAGAGLDLEMPHAVFMNRDSLLPAIKMGKLSEAAIDDKVTRMLRVMFQMGWFDREQTAGSVAGAQKAAAPIALQAAREGIVLLKNENKLLPLKSGFIKKIALIGPEVEPLVCGGGGSSRVNPVSTVSFLDGIKTQAGKDIAVEYQPGVQFLSGAAFNSDAQFFTIDTAGDGKPKEVSGLRGEYFANMNLAGLPAFSRIDPAPRFDNLDSIVPGKFPSDSFSIRWTGEFRTTEAGNYQFIVQGDDGFRIYIDEQILIDYWHDGITSKSATLPLEANSVHDVTIEYYEHAGGSFLRFGFIAPDNKLLQKAVHAASDADVAIVCVGFNPDLESEGEDRTFALPNDQQMLLKEIAKANKHMVVVLTAGGNVDMRDWIDDAKGLLHVWYPGQEGGTALAEILFGVVNPSGKLPVSFEKRWEDNACFNSYYDSASPGHVSYNEGVFVGYRHFDKDDIEPMFPFGYGLSYTTFEYRDLKLVQSKIKAGAARAGMMKAVFEIRNTGKREGSEVAQLYIHQDLPSEPRPLKELKGFAKISLKPGESRIVEIPIDRSAFSFFSEKQNSWITEPGKFEVLVGASSRDIRLKKEFSLK